MDVAIIGASGDCGRQMAIQLVAEGILPRTNRLQLVGREGGSSGRTLFGLKTDISDAFAEHTPEIDIALSPDEIAADIIVFTAGLTVPPDPKKLKDVSRTSLADTNGPLFAEYAKAIKKYGDGDEVVIMVTNPVELGVDLFARELGRHRVIGIGAYSDTMRFRREIAADVGVRRQKVHGFMVGEHGDGMVPLWSSVRIHSMDNEELETLIDRMRGGSRIIDFPDHVAEAKKTVVELLREGQIREAFERVSNLRPDIRTIMVPYITHLSGAKTACATANVTVDLVRTLMDGREVVVAGQVMLDGEFYDIHGTIGVPIVVGMQGWNRVVPVNLWEDETRLLRKAVASVNERLAGWHA